jgi:mRNA-degrading endonuclease YafQ of YafQ-DinJ toxin-antitoxin module
MPELTLLRFKRTAQLQLEEANKSMKEENEKMKDECSKLKNDITLKDQVSPLPPLAAFKQCRDCHLQFIILHHCTY